MPFPLPGGPNTIGTLVIADTDADQNFADPNAVSFHEPLQGIFST